LILDRIAAHVATMSFDALVGQGPLRNLVSGVLKDTTKPTSASPRYVRNVVEPAPDQSQLAGAYTAGWWWSCLSGAQGLVVIAVLGLLAALSAGSGAGTGLADVAASAADHPLAASWLLLLLLLAWLMAGALFARSTWVSQTRQARTRYVAYRVSMDARWSAEPTQLGMAIKKLLVDAKCAQPSSNLVAVKQLGAAVKETFAARPAAGATCLLVLGATVGPHQAWTDAPLLGCCEGASFSLSCDAAFWALVGEGQMEAFHAKLEEVLRRDPALSLLEQDKAVV
jgi:hypothetical protein